MPGIEASFSRTSVRNSSCERSFKSKLTSISAPLVDCECSSSSPRPVRLAVDVTSGIESNSLSMILPRLLFSNNETPGLHTAEIVNEPSLKSGKKLCPILKNRPKAISNTTIVPPKIDFLCDNAHSKERP